MSFLVKVVALSVTVACTVGLEPLMFPTGLTEVMVTPLRPPRVGPLLAPDLVLGLDLPAVLLFLGLPTLAPSFYRSFSMLSSLDVADRDPAPRMIRDRGSLPLGTRSLCAGKELRWTRKLIGLSNRRSLGMLSQIPGSCARQGAA
jgi:hypothetical protein